ncbi:Histone-lysine N-methyltransferase PR-Set7 [Dirofilaria immitis]
MAHRKASQIHAHISSCIGGDVSSDDYDYNHDHLPISTTTTRRQVTEASPTRRPTRRQLAQRKKDERSEGTTVGSFSCLLAWLFWSGVVVVVVVILLDTENTGQTAVVC